MSRIDFQRELLKREEQRKIIDKAVSSALESFALRLNEARKQDALAFIDEVRNAYTQAKPENREAVVTGLLLEKLFDVGYKEVVQYCKEVVYK